MSDRMLQIELKFEEGNLILEALAEHPFKLVFELIGKLNQQANNLFAESMEHSQSKQFLFSERELAITIRALGELPYNRVNRLLRGLNQQIALQLNDQPANKVDIAHA